MTILLNNLDRYFSFLLFTVEINDIES